MPGEKDPETHRSFHPFFDAFTFNNWLDRRLWRNFISTNDGIMQELDAKDLHILRILQRDSSVSAADIAEKVHLSVNACWRRIKRLQLEIIDKQVAILNPAHFGIGLSVFVSVRTNQHNEAWLDQFSAGVSEIAEVVEFYRLSGETDYLLKVLTRDIADYDRVYKQIIKAAPLSDVSSSFAMERIKSTTSLPI
jgi:Lrp/AsnC family transcriptional regulator